MVATRQHDNLARHLKFRVSTNEDDPLVLRLNISVRTDVRGAHYSLHHEVLVREQNI